MQRISSNLTLFFKIFLPTFWIVFFGAVLLAALLSPYQSVGGAPRLTFQIALAFFFASGAAMLYFTLMRLKRVEMDENFIYVTNYFKTYRYPYHNVEKIEISRFLFLTTGSLHLQTPGSFGRRITFLASAFRLRDFLNNHPAVAKELAVNGLGNRKTD